MARQIISLTDTETFSELQGVYSQINDALLDFEQTMTPLTDIIDAIYKLRTNDVTLDIYEEIKRDREHEQKLAAERAEQEAKLEALQAEIGALNRDNATLATDKGFFGGIRKRSLKLIAGNEVTLAEKKAELDALTADIETTARAEGPQTAFAQFKEEKARLRELLDISSDQHKERQQQMIEKAIQFVDTTENRVGQVLTHFDGMNEQIDRLADANFQMRSVYAILNDATDDAHKITEDRRSQIKTDLEGKGEIEKLDAEEKLRNLENHVTQLSKTDVDTTRLLAELTQAGSRVQSMKENNDQQVSNTRALHTSGVAGVADQLSTVLQAVSSAALGEASHAAKMSEQVAEEAQVLRLFLESTAAVVGVVGSLCESPSQFCLLAVDILCIADAASRAAGGSYALDLLADQFHHLGAIRIPAAASWTREHAHEGFGAGRSSIQCEWRCYYGGDYQMALHEVLPSRFSPAFR